MELNALTAPLTVHEIEWRLYGSYYVYSNGKVWSIRTKRFVGRMNSNGYMSYWDSSTKKDIKIHRAVAICFLPNPNNYEQVNHIDGDKRNNHVTNLEWCNQSQNVQHAYDNGLMKKGHDQTLYNTKGVRAFRYCILVGDYISINEAARKLNLSQGNISMVLQGKRTHTQGYTFQIL